MRRIVPALLILFVLVLTVACTTTPAAAPPSMPVPSPMLVSVAFESRPDGAELYLDGNLVGSTGMNYRLPPGVHVVEMRRPGYETWRRELLVNAQNPTKLNAVLIPQK